MKYFLKNVQKTDAVEINSRFAKDSQNKGIFANLLKEFFLGSPFAISEDGACILIQKPSFVRPETIGCDMVFIVGERIYEFTIEGFFGEAVRFTRPSGEMVSDCVRSEIVCAFDAYGASGNGADNSLGPVEKFVPDFRN